MSQRISMMVAMVIAAGALMIPAMAAAPPGVTENAKLTAWDPAAEDFGSAIAVSGDTVVVGAREDFELGELAGAAYVFVWNGSSWTQEAKLTASDGDAFDRFGEAVAIEGDTIVVGVRLDEGPFVSGQAGSAYVFTRSGTTWTEQAKLTASDAAQGDLFGYSVALSGDTLLVGAASTDEGAEDSGSAHVFTRSGTTWTEQAKLGASDPQAGDEMGRSVALVGDTALVGTLVAITVFSPDSITEIPYL